MSLCHVVTFTDWAEPRVMDKERSPKKSYSISHRVFHFILFSCESCLQDAPFLDDRSKA
jgi:hypothetical protein